MVGWHHELNGYEFEQAPGISDRQGSLMCCTPWGHKGSDMTEQLNWIYFVLNQERGTLSMVKKIFIGLTLSSWDPMISFCCWRMYVVRPYYLSILYSLSDNMSSWIMLFFANNYFLSPTKWLVPCYQELVYAWTVFGQS